MSKSNAARPPNASLSSTIHYCPKPFCGRELALQHAQGGAHAGSDYLHCNSPTHEKPYWRFFPPAQLPHSHRPVAPAQTVPNGAPKTRCAHRNCKRSPNTLCESKKCKPHCVSSGGCHCPGHRLEKKPTTEYSGRFLDSIAHDLDHMFTPITRSINQPSPRAQQLRADHPNWFLSPSLSPKQPSSSPLPNPPQRTLAQFSEHSLLLVEFHEDGKPALVSGIQDLPDYPFWRRPGREPYQCYSQDYRTWMTVQPSYVHDLRNKRRVLIRSIGVVGSDEVVQIQQLHADVADAEETGLIARTNSRLSRYTTSHVPSSSSSLTAPMTKGNSKRSRKESSDDDEVIIVGYQRAIKTEPVTPPPKRHRPHLALDIPIYPSPSLPPLSASTSTECPSTSSLPSPGSSPVFPARVLSSPYPKAWRF
ncbi:hypothetical protein B0H11DRAFT_2232052 [Mycena galericulata]|nr:hypothetical protein B0H11DRAFT_2232052 [Mycena galericulata]